MKTLKRFWRRVKCAFGYHSYITRRGLSGGFLDGFCEWEECVYCHYEK